MSRRALAFHTPCGGLTGAQGCQRQFGALVRLRQKLLPNASVKFEPSSP
ncbi:MAG: hypothetical protein IT456_09330 [Planctomycetes bacterium]|nr:hypothetical protein [Planctomycetota bacterium]